jgi:hypothetical protein
VYDTHVVWVKRAAFSRPTYRGSVIGRPSILLVLAACHRRDSGRGIAWCARSDECAATRMLGGVEHGGRSRENQIQGGCKRHPTQLQRTGTLTVLARPKTNSVCDERCWLTATAATDTGTRKSPKTIHNQSATEKRFRMRPVRTPILRG